MTTVFGTSDDLVQIYDGNDHIREIDCYEEDVYVYFSDGTEICVHYGFIDKAIWKISVIRLGSAYLSIHLDSCFDEDSVPYSDVFTIDATMIDRECVPWKWGKRHEID